MEKMTENKDFIIQIKGLPIGKHQYDFPIDGSFFKQFENSQILDASLNAYTELEKGSGWMKVNCNIEGSVTVVCDRCLDELEIPMDFYSSVAVKFAKTDDDPQDDEFIIMDPADGELDLSQFLYDYVCINLPLQTVHDEGKCNPDMMKKLSEVKHEEPVEGGNAENSPFGVLKELLERKK